MRTEAVLEKMSSRFPRAPSHELSTTNLSVLWPVRSLASWVAKSRWVPPIIIHQRYQSFAGATIEPPVADEVEDVEFSLTHGPLQLTPALTLEPGELEIAILLQAFDSFIDALLFLLDVQRRAVIGAGDHPENAERRLDSQAMWGTRELDITYNRRIGGKADVIALVSIVEKLPWQTGQLRSLNAEAYS
jgi:hypothetical protein